MSTADSENTLETSINDHERKQHQQRNGRLSQALSGNTGTLVYRGLVMVFMAVFTGIGIPVVVNAGNLLIELSSKVDRVPLQLDAVKSDITLLKATVHGRQELQDMQQVAQGSAIQRLTADQATALQDINRRLGDLSREINALDKQYAILTTQMESLLDANRRQNPGNPPRR